MRRFAREFGWLLIALAVFAIGLTYWLQAAKPNRHTLRMTAGDANGLRHRLAVELSRQMEHNGIHLKVEPTQGSEEAIEGVASGKFDMAMVQGGLAIQPESSIQLVSALHVEPLHLLVAPDIYGRIQSQGLPGLVDCTVNLGPVESGTYSLAKMVLQMAGLSARSDGQPAYKGLNLSFSELTKANPLPQAVFVVSSMPAPLAEFLVDVHHYRLAPLDFGEAVAISSLAELGEDLQPGAIDKRFIFETTIPAYTYNISFREPDTDIKTLGTRLLIIANQRVKSDAIKQFLQSLFESSLAKATHPPLDASLLDLPAEYPLHAGAASYRKRNRPIIAGDAIDMTEKVLAITATVLGGFFVVIQWLIHNHKKRLEASFAGYLQRVLRIESTIFENESAAALDLSELIRLQRELGELKSEAVRRFANGELESEGLINGFLAMTNDARQQLTRLILHQRENIEQLAHEKHVAPDVVWREQADKESAHDGEY